MTLSDIFTQILTGLLDQSLSCSFSWLDIFNGNIICYWDEFINWVCIHSLKFIGLGKRIGQDQWSTCTFHRALLKTLCIPPGNGCKWTDLPPVMDFYWLLC